MKALLHPTLLLSCCTLPLTSCSVVQSISSRTEIIHALSDQAQLQSPLTPEAKPLDTEITFPRHRYHLTYAQQAKLLKLAPSWKEAAKPIIVAGFASPGGLPEYSRMLSQRRAEEVRAVLIGAGLDAAKLHTVGFGSDIPSQPNSDLVRLYSP